VQVLLSDPEPMMYHAEIVRRDGVAAGYIRAASYGHTLGGAVGLAMVECDSGPVDADWLGSGAWTVEIAGCTYPATVSLKPLYDPTNARIRA
jgi:4-methylaminobutanoate oxidase (formaldehyde-forming)